MGCHRGIRNNTKGKLYTDEKEYLKALQKSDLEDYKKSNETYIRKRGRPKKLPDKPIHKQFGEFILFFD
jgi:hypothetical protein